MKNKILYILILAVFFIAQAAFAEEQTITFLGNTYNLAFSARGAGGGFYNEYVKNGQTVKNWNEIMVIHHFPLAKSPLTEAKKLSSVITAIYAKQNKKAPVALSYNDKKDSAIVDFVMPVLDENKNLKCLEFNVFKYEKSPDGRGLRAIQYSKRFFKNELQNETTFQQNLAQTRTKVMNAIPAIETPQIVEKAIQ